jgi:hypothetical protein
MPLRRKPAAPASDIDERRIDGLIDKGGTVAVDTASPAATTLGSLQLRLDLALIARIDRARARRTVPPSRMNWILEALLEKLAREKAR